MATTINSLCMVRMAGFTNATAAANRTLTVTRRLRMMDCKVRLTTAVAGAVTVTVTNGATPCITFPSPAGVVFTQNVQYRLGASLGGVATDLLLTGANADLILPGGTMVFAIGAGGGANACEAEVTCFPDPGATR